MSAAARLTGLLEFDADTHAYRLDGVAIPSVTQILKAAGMYSYLDAVHPDRLEKARLRGVAVHRAIELYANGTLDWSTVSDEVAGYVEGYTAWAAVRGWQPSLVEHRFCHPVYRYAGTLDQGGKLGYGEEAVVDFKTMLVFGPAAAAAARLQLAAYCHHAPKPFLKRRIILQLKGNGKYQEHSYPSTTLARDFQIFLAALTVHNYKQQERLV